MLFTPGQIRKVLLKELPGAISHKRMLPAERHLKPPSNSLTGIKRSSVLLLLYPDSKTLHACLIKRPQHMKHHAGQIALPGGRIEKNESPLETALRETEEEIGIKPHDIEMLGTLSQLYIEVSGFIIQPFVGWLKEAPEFRINREEVEKTVLFPLFNFRDKFDSVEIETATGRLKVPCILYKEEIIWGATAMILSEFYDATSSLFKNHI